VVVADVCRRNREDGHLHLLTAVFVHVIDEQEGTTADDVQGILAYPIYKFRKAFTQIWSTN